MLPTSKAVRPSCTAANAYRPALALLQGLLTLWTSVQSGSQHKSRSSRPHGLRSGSTASTAPAETRKLDRDPAAGGVRKGLWGSTFSDYETLMSSFEPETKTKVDDSRNAVRKNMSKTQSQDGGERKLLLRGYEASPPTEAYARKENSPKRQLPKRPSQTQTPSPGKLARPDYRKNQDKPKMSQDERSKKTLIEDEGMGIQEFKAAMHTLARRAHNLSGQALVEVTDIAAARNKLDYDGMYLKKIVPSSRSSIAEPWILDHEEAKMCSREEILAQEIARFGEFIKPTPVEQIAVDAVMAEVKGLIFRHMGPRIASEVFGSQTTDLARCVSDIDIRVFHDDASRNGTRKGDVYVHKKLKHLSTELNRGNDFILVVHRAQRNHSILNVQHRLSGIDVQIIARHDPLIQEIATRRFLADIPNLSDLFHVVHTIFSMRGLVDAYNGGVGSYGILMMLVASLKHCGRVELPTAGHQLIHFLKFYRYLDTTKYGVSVSPAKFFKKHDVSDTPIQQYAKVAGHRGDLIRAGQWKLGERNLLQPYLFCIQDPAKPDNDVAHRSHATKHIIATLRKLHEKAATEVDCFKRAREAGILWRNSLLFQQMIGRPHEVWLERRQKLEGYGREVLRRQKEAEEAHKSPGTGTQQEDELMASGLQADLQSGEHGAKEEPAGSEVATPGQRQEAQDKLLEMWNAVDDPRLDQGHDEDAARPSVGDEKGS